MSLYILVSLIVNICLLHSAESATRTGNCLPYDALNKNSSFICEGDFISIHNVWLDGAPRFLGIKQQPERDRRNQRLMTTPDANDTSTAFQIFPLEPWTTGVPSAWTTFPPQYVRDSIANGPIYPFKLRDMKGRWVKADLWIRKHKYQTLYVNNKQTATDLNADVLFYIPNHSFTARSSSAGGEPSGWIVRGSDGAVFWKNGYDYTPSKVKRDLGDMDEVESSIQGDVKHEQRLQARFLGFSGKKKPAFENDEVIFDGGGPKPRAFPGCDTLSLWTIAQTQSPPYYTGYTETIVNVKYDLDTAMKNLILHNEVAPNVGNATVTNESPTEQNLILTLSTTKSNSWTFTKDRRYSFSFSGSTWIGMPFLATGMQLSMGMELGSSTGTGHSHSQTTHYSASVTIPVPAQSMMAGQLWLTKAEMKNVPFTFTVIRTWPNKEQISFDVVNSVDILQYYDAVVCISQALNMSAGVTPSCTPPPFRMWNKNGTEHVLPFKLQA